MRDKMSKEEKHYVITYLILCQLLIKISKIFKTRLLSDIIENVI